MIWTPQSHQHCTLENFDWKGREKLKSIVDALLENKRKGIVLFGPPGVGKTHLFVGMFRKLVEKGMLLGSEVIYIQFSELVGEVLNGYELGVTLEKLVSRMMVKYLIVDDVRPVAGERWKHILKVLIENAYTHEIRFCFSTNADTENELWSYLLLEDYYISRILYMCSLVHVTGSDRRQVG